MSNKREDKTHWGGFFSSKSIAIAEQLLLTCGDIVPMKNGLYPNIIASGFCRGAFHSR